MKVQAAFEVWKSSLHFLCVEFLMKFCARARASGSRSQVLSEGSLHFFDFFHARLVDV